MDVVSKWKIPHLEMFRFNSFKPFLPLLKCFELPGVQLYFIWFICYLCSKNRENYLLQTILNKILMIYF
jgi:hypothetical protein